MVMFYDVLLADEVNYPYTSYDSRRRRLQARIQRLPERADIGTRTRIDFRRPGAAKHLREIM